MSNGGVSQIRDFAVTTVGESNKKPEASDSDVPDITLLPPTPKMESVDQMNTETPQTSQEDKKNLMDLAILVSQVLELRFVNMLEKRKVRKGRKRHTGKFGSYLRATEKAKGVTRLTKL